MARFFASRINVQKRIIVQSRSRALDQNLYKRNHSAVGDSHFSPPPKRIARDIHVLFRLLVDTDSEIKPEEREHMFEQKLGGIIISGHNGDLENPQSWNVSLMDVLNQNFDIEEGFIDPEQTKDVIEQDILEPLALRSYKIMKEIVEGIYGHPPTQKNQS